MSLSINDARIFSSTLKKARKKKHLTQAQCAELLDHSLSFQKDLERCRCSPSIENFYQICRILDISADSCIFPENPREDSTYHELLRLLSQCDEKSLSVLVATAAALIENSASPAPLPSAPKQT
ncbi:MAG: helix-turn-helix domain-containing protein [Lachnospiraceae bacterium]|nr:helix-turn-helix domain-containing protein [Lachnospiraceae bacterium]